MWKITLILNSLLLFLFWFAGLAVISPAFNHFVQYPETAGSALQLLTERAISARMMMGIVPVTFSVLSFFIYKILKEKTPEYRNEYLLMLVSATLTVGLSIFIFFLIAGVLPYLKIGVIIR